MLDYQFLKTNIFNIVNVDAQKVLNSIEDDDEDKNCDSIGDTNNGSSNPRKRKRLDDFTPQERMIRRKLKNRAAAQHARDRKKERMDHLEKVVSQLEVENKELKRNNEELRTNMHVLMAQNQELLEHLRKEDNSNNTKDKKLDTTSSSHRVPELGTDHTYYAKVEPDAEMPSVTTIEEDNHVVIKKEEESVEKHASLEISLPQKLQILLVSLITMWLTNPKLSNYLTSLSTSNQEKVLKEMILRKLEPKLKQTNSKAIQALLQTNLVPILERYRKKKQMNYSSSVRRSKILLGRTNRIP